MKPETRIAAKDPEPMPVTILTGFLGSGKTTLLNRVLGDPAMRDTAVVVNEFGTVAIDHELIHHGREEYIVTSAGCICCTAGSDIRTSLYEVAAAAEAGSFPSFSRVIVETTGLADPAPIINGLTPGAFPAKGLGDHIVARRFRIASVVCTFDAILGELALARNLECWKQLAFADRIVLTKLDLARDPATRRDIEDLRRRIGDLNPAAEIVLGCGHDDRPARLFEEAPYTLDGKPEDILGWLALDRAEAETPHAHAHAHDVNRHGDRIRAESFIESEPLDPQMFLNFVGLVGAQPGVLRLKGIVALADDIDSPLVVHGVQHILHDKIRLPAWPSDDRRSRIVVLGENLAVDAIADLFRSVVKKPRRRWLAGWRR